MRLEWNMGKINGWEWDQEEHKDKCGKQFDEVRSLVLMGKSLD